MDKKPEKPDESECCGSGCKPCIFDIYEEQLKKWKSKSSKLFESRFLSQVKWLPFLVTNIQNVTNLIKEIKFCAVVLKNKNHNGVLIKNANLNVDYEVVEESLNIEAGKYVIIKGVYTSENKDVIISRSYTPVFDKTSFENGKFRIIVSLQPNGKMSQFFTKLSQNDIIFCRGPYQEIEYHSNSFKQVLLIGGGTGVVPLYNISKSIVENDKDDTLINVLCSFKTINHILLRAEYKSLTHYWNFHVTTFISNQDVSDFKPDYNEMILFKKIDAIVISDEIKKYKNENILVMVSGPLKFNELVKNSLIKCGIKDENILVLSYIVFFKYCPKMNQFFYKPAEKIIFGRSLPLPKFAYSLFLENAPSSTTIYLNSVGTAVPQSWGIL